MARGVRSAGDRARRREMRARLGPLRNNQLKPGTLKRYGDAVNNFFSWMDRMSLPVPPRTGDFDVLLCEYLEHLWQEGDALALAGDTLSGLTHEVKNLKGSLRESWALWDLAVPRAADSGAAALGRSGLRHGRLGARKR